ncbi:hypothetical protein FKM82_011203 [Ascaphus truei]
MCDTLSPSTHLCCCSELESSIESTNVKMHFVSDATYSGRVGEHAVQCLTLKLAYLNIKLCLLRGGGHIVKNLCVY